MGREDGEMKRIRETILPEREECAQLYGYEEN
jgi:hypothetical protein